MRVSQRDWLPVLAVKSTRWVSTVLVDCLFEGTCHLPGVAAGGGHPFTRCGTYIHAITFLLVTNNDGIESPALVPLVRGLRALAPVRAVVPDRERSWIGKAITRHDDVVVKRADREGCELWTTTGYPADCAQLGMHTLFDERAEMPAGADVLSVNFPDTATLSTPREVTRLARTSYDQLFQARRETPGAYFHDFGGFRDLDGIDGTDLAAARRGHVSITPLRLAHTAVIPDADRRALEKP